MNPVKTKHYSVKFKPDIIAENKKNEDIHYILSNSDDYYKRMEISLLSSKIVFSYFYQKNIKPFNIELTDQQIQNALNEYEPESHPALISILFEDLNIIKNKNEIQNFKNNVCALKDTAEWVNDIVHLKENNENYY